MKDGAQSLLQWLEHVFAEGIHILENDPQLLEDMAASLSDFKLGAMAKRLRLISEETTWKADWPVEAETDLLRMHRAALGLKHWEKQSLEWKWDIAQFVGVNIKKNEVLDLPGKKTRFIVVGRKEEVEERLTVHRTYILTREGQYGEIIDFTFANAKPQLMPIGNRYNGDVHFYPSGVPTRCLIKDYRYEKEPWEARPGISSWVDLKDQIATSLLKQPWLTEMVLSLSPTAVEIEGEKTVLVDQEGAGFALKLPPSLRSRLWGGSRETDLHINMLWRGKHFEVLSVFAYGQLMLTKV
jgi:hypothetical protein